MNLLEGPCEHCNQKQWQEIVGGQCVCEDCASDTRKRRALILVFALAALAWASFLVWVGMWAWSERGLWLK